jgi:predicted metal-binding protein
MSLDIDPWGFGAPRAVGTPWLRASAPMGIRLTETPNALLPRLHVCTTCRAGLPLPEGETPPGAMLHRAIAEAVTQAAAPPFVVEPVVCLSSCSQGCAAAISMPGKWTYVLGHLTPALIGDLLTYGAAYAASATGTVLPSRRPAALRDMILARVPCLERAA